MIMEIFTVFDSAAARYLEPFFAPTVEVALRRFRQTVNQPAADNPIALYPEDYSLYHIGTYHQETGELVPFGELHSLGVAITFVNKPRLEQDGTDG